MNYEYESFLPNGEGPPTPPEIRREESTERFLQIFRDVTGMASLQELGEQGAIQVPRNAEYAWIWGAVIVGSSTNPDSQPKDLDVVFVTERIHTRGHEYVEEVRYNFDQAYSAVSHKSSQRSQPFQVEHGRMDFLGFLAPDPSIDQRLQMETVRRAHAPMVYGFNPETAEDIAGFVRLIRGEDEEPSSQ